MTGDIKNLGRRVAAIFGITLVTSLITANSSLAADWVYTQQKDEMTGKITRYACVGSENVLEFAFPYNGGTGAELCLRNSPRWGNDVIIRVFKGQFLCHSDNCSLRVKFDSQDPVTFGGNQLADGSSNYIFIEGFSRFLSATRKAQTVLIGARFFQEGEKVMRFNVTGLDWK